MKKQCMNVVIMRMSQAILLGALSSHALSAAQGPCDPAGLFAEWPALALPAAPVHIEVDDLNRDRVPDLIAVTTDLDSISVWMGNGDGTFAPRTDLPVGTDPQRFAIGDLDNDGDNDIAVANSGSDSVSLLYNDGSGVFAPHVTVPTGREPFDVAIGKMNFDELPDLVVAHQRDDNIWVLRNNGPDGFNVFRIRDAVDGPTWLDLLDLDGDFDLDVMVIAGSGQQLLTFTNLGNADLALEQSIQLDTAPTAPAFGDIDGDGDPDLAIPCVIPGVVFLLENTGAGTFQIAGSFISEERPFGAVLADLNADGVTDLALSHQGRSETDDGVAIRLGAGDFTFGPETRFAVGSSSPGLAAADINEDGGIDLIHPNDNTNDIGCLRNTCPPDPCNQADLSIPRGVLDLADLNAFIVAFLAMDPQADLAAPAGSFDLADINAFGAAFLAGCP